MSPSIRFGKFWVAVLVLMPAILLLQMILHWRVPVPYEDTWSFVGQYEAWMDGRFPWRECLAKEGDHPAAVPRAVYFAVLHWLGGNVAVLPLLSWLLSAVIAVCVLLLMRPLCSGHRVSGALLLFLGSLVVFNASLGGAWIWDCAYDMQILGACFALSVLLATGARLDRWRAAALLVLNVTACFSHAAGFLVGLAVAPLIWHWMDQVPVSRKTAVIFAWLAFTALCAGIALTAFGSAGHTMARTVHLVDVLGRPLMRLHFLLSLLGQMLGKVTVLEPLTVSSICGGLMLVLFAACVVHVLRHRLDRGLVSAALPWGMLCFFALSFCALVTVGRLHDSMTNSDTLGEKAMAERFISVSRFFVIGIVCLTVAVARHAGGVMRRIWQASAAPAYTLLIALLCANWAAGADLMRLEHMLMGQERAMLAFGGLVPLDGNRLWLRQLKYHTVTYARKLQEMGRLPGVKFAPDTRISSFEKGPPMSAKGSRFERVERPRAGWVSFSGRSGSDTYLPDLIVITAQSTDEATAEEKIVAVVAPTLPEIFLERASQRQRYPEHYYGWSGQVEARRLPVGKVTLRAYAFEHGFNRVHAIEGSHLLENPAVNRLTTPQS